VRHLGEAVLQGDALRPVLHGRALHLDRLAARAAHEVVVVVLGAAPVGGLAGAGAQHVDLAGVGQGLQGAVDRGQADAVAAPAQLLVDLLRGAEVGELVEQVRDRGALTGRPLPRHRRGARSGHDSSSTWVTASTTMWARWSSTRR
jgi:hypothetical protein